MLPPEPEQGGVAADEQIRQYDFHGRVSRLRRNVQRIREPCQDKASFTDHRQNSGIGPFLITRPVHNECSYIAPGIIWKIWSGVTCVFIISESTGEMINM